MKAENRGIFKVKVEYEEMPIVDSKVTIDGLDKLFKDIKRKHG